MPDAKPRPDMRIDGLELPKIFGEIIASDHGHHRVMRVWRVRGVCAACGACVCV